MNSGPLLSAGSTGDDVRRVQRLLVMMKLLDYTGIDGIFGPQTTASVQTFQQSSGLTADGIVGPATWSALPADPRTPQLAAGSSGPAVSALQTGLLAYGGAGSATDPGPIDGIFGPQTTAAVKAYQSARGTYADGIVGDATWWIPAGAAGATLASLAGATTV
ncbi:peptidoglycan-binding protein [Vulcanimicrobium alpinum]|nr:peptidoglycan-binding protein [Vulcanimicrobium alpinum]